jgi:glycyl-tRNA synthetase beta chain
MLLQKGYGLPLDILVEKALQSLSGGKDLQEVKGKILQFFENRLEIVFSDLGYGYDIVQSVLSLSSSVQLREISDRLDALRKFKDSRAYNDFLAAVKRVNNIIPKTEVPELKADLLMEEAEKQLGEKLDSVRHDIPVILNDRKYYDAIILLSSLTDSINNFFDKVLVMDKNEEIKMNKLSLLNEIWRTVSTIADFSKLSASQ